MSRAMPITARSVLLAALLAWAPAALLHGQERERPLIPARVEVSATLRAAVDDDLLTEAERTELQLFHGLYDELPDAARGTPEYALATYDLRHPSLRDEGTPVPLRASAAYLRGDLHTVLELLEGGAAESPPAQLLRGRALAGLGRFNEAIEALHPLREAARRGEPGSAADLTAAAEAVAELASLEGRPAADYQFVMDKLGEAQQRLDRLHYPALIAQARLLAEKDNPEDAVATLHEALRLNPNSSEVWALLGELALRGFDFDSAHGAILRLRRIQPAHVLADALEVELYLRQRDPFTAEAPLVEGLTRYPNHRRLLALAPAVAAMQYDEELAEAAFARFDSVSGKSPQALYIAGRHLSAGRQYEEGERLLRAAIDRQPNWPRPHIELGLLLNQSGKDAEALAVLKHVSRIDPFNKRAVNILKLMEEIADFQRLETDHFIIKYRDEIEGVLAADMAPYLERTYRELTEILGHEPRFKTQIDIMPDRRWFAIRITGMPWIWTIGAATGPVVAITPPREGAYQAGHFDWQRVMRHEFTHTINLDQTDNRVAHWFTEACAVAQEPEPRDYQTARMLAEALAEDELFDLESINWGFVRPRRPQDRSLAYAQSHWMYEYITERFGHRMVLDILDLSRRGVPQGRVVTRATGQSESEFMAGFTEWARRQAESWGLAPDPPTERIMSELGVSPGDGAVDSGEVIERVGELLGEHPDHPDLLRIAASAALEREEQAEARALLLRYADARPVDPWADRSLAELALRAGRAEDALPHLEQLDRFDQHSGAHARTMLRIYRDLGDVEGAARAADRALARTPYDPALRETAATLALQLGDSDGAVRHVRALTLIEPDRHIHFTRLAALHHRLGDADAAHTAAVRARELNADAPVDRFLREE